MYAHTGNETLLIVVIAPLNHCVTPNNTMYIRKSHVYGVIWHPELTGVGSYIGITVTRVGSYIGVTLHHVQRGSEAPRSKRGGIIHRGHVNRGGITHRCHVNRGWFTHRGHVGLFRLGRRCWRKRGRWRGTAADDPRTPRQCPTQGEQSTS